MASKRVIVFFVLCNFFLLTLCGCKKAVNNKQIVIWTSCAEFAQYIEAFNKTHPKQKAVLVYKDNPALYLPPAKDEHRPDIIIGPWLESEKLSKNFKSLNYLFERKSLTSSIFYEQLLNAGKNRNTQYLLPVSYNLPTIIFDKSNAEFVTDGYTLNQNQIKEIATKYNEMDKKGNYTRMGFVPSNSTDFLYLMTKLNHVDFRNEKDVILYNEGALKNTCTFLKSWIATSNVSAQVEQDFAFKYLYMPDYRQVSSGKTLLVYTTSDKLFKTMRDQSLNIDYRWLSDGKNIPVEDSMTMLGIYKKCNNQPGATEFISWFFDSQNQEAMIARKIDLNLNTEIFGIAGGFSAVRDVTEHILPVYYNQLLTNLPPAAMLEAPQKLPARWRTYETSVVESYISNAISAAAGEEIPSIADLEKEWRKKVFD